MLDRVQEEYNVHYAEDKMGLCGCFRRPEWVSSRTIFQQEEEHFKHGTGFQNRCSVRGTMEPTVVLNSTPPFLRLKTT